MAEVKNICLEALERHCISGDKGRLDFLHNGHEGQIYTEHKFLVHAQLGGLEGVPALFRLFDWGDAETTWNAGLEADRHSLNLTMDAASVLYAENLHERAEMEEQQDAERLDEVLLKPELVAGQAEGVTSVLKHYSVTLECTDPSLLPGGVTFADTSKSSYIIGSSDECDIVLHQPGIEALHCGVILENGCVTIWDLGSQAGTKLNGIPVTQGVLKVGDIMALGPINFSVRFQLRRPNLRRPAPAAGAGASLAATAAAAAAASPNISTTPLVRAGAPPKELPKGAITYEKVSRQLKQNDKSAPFLSKLSSLFGAKDRK
jgi:hypothetical protein